MSSAIYEGLLTLGQAQPRLLKHLRREADPVAKAQSRYRLVWNAVQQNPDLAVRVGGRLFILDQQPKLDALAEALGMQPPVPKPSRARRQQAVPSSERAMVAAA